MKTMNLRKTNLYENTKSIRTSICTSAYLHICTFLLICTFAHLHINTFAQNVGISATGINPDNSAMLDVTSNTKGMLIPRMTGAEKYAIPSPATGLLIYQTDTTGFWYYDGTKWIPLVSSTSSTASPSNAGWLTTGNIGTAWNKNFLGTTDNVSLRMRTNDTTRMIVDSLGRVGIGTTSPGYKLHISDTNSPGSGINSYSLNTVQIRTEPNITTNTMAITSSNMLLYRMTEGTPGTQGYGYGASNTAYIDGGAYTFFWLRGADNIAYTYSTATTNQGNLAGAVNTGRLHSSGNLTNCYGAYNQSIAYNGSSGTITNAYGSNNTANMNFASGTITNAYGSASRINSISNTGGSITNAYSVHSYIYAAAASPPITTAYLYYGEYPGGAAVTTPWGIYLTGESKNYFSGKVGIGTASPKCALSFGATLAPFTISGGAVRTDSKILLYDLDANNWSGLGSDAFGNFWLKTGNGATYNYLTMLAATGNVGIGCTDPKYKLHVIGDIASSATIRGVNAYVTGAITACSDIRYKKDITPLSHALSNVMKLQGVNYHWKAKEFPEKQFTAVQQIGFIAQELEKIIPEVVLTDKDGYKSVDYSRLTPVLVEAIKEQQKTIDSQQLAIAELKAAVNKLLQQSTTAAAKK